MSKKFLWFLIGMIIAVSIPVLLFNREVPHKETSSKQSPPEEIEMRKNQTKKPDSVNDAHIPAKGAQYLGRGGSSAKQGAY